MKITIGDQNNNDDQLSSAIINAKDGDVIELLPGIYFSAANPFICTIRRNITFVGRSKNKDDIKLYCSFTIGNKNIIILRNLTLAYTANSENTLSAYDGAEIYGNNVAIDRQTSDDWDTIYGQNSFFSFKDSAILTGAKTKTIGLSLENSQLFADNTSFQLLFQKNSQVYLKDATVLHRLELRQHSHLNFKNLKIDTSNVRIKNDLVVKSHSDISGEDLIFTKSSPQIRVLESNFKVDNFQPELEQIQFKFDDTSQVMADGKNLSNKNTK